MLLPEIETDDLPDTAAALGFPDEGLETEDLKSIFQSAQHLVANPGDFVLVRAFNYYLNFDAYLPSIDVPDPPPLESGASRPGQAILSVARCRARRYGMPKDGV